LEVHDDLVMIMSRHRNWSDYRKELNILRQMLVATQSELTGCVPFLGLSLSDLVFAEEGNPDLQVSAEPVSSLPPTTLAPSTSNRPGSISSLKARLRPKKLQEQDSLQRQLSSSSLSSNSSVTSASAKSASHRVSSVSNLNAPISTGTPNKSIQIINFIQRQKIARTIRDVRLFQSSCQHQQVNATHQDLDMLLRGLLEVTEIELDDLSKDGLSRSSSLAFDSARPYSGGSRPLSTYLPTENDLYNVSLSVEPKEFIRKLNRMSVRADSAS
jgi:hypothetical protein